MALALRAAARLKPEVQLSRALRDFEQVLTQAQTRQLDEFRSEACPGPSAPLKLASVLDGTLRGRRSRQCMGPRVVSLLQGIQQFASVVDVVVGGSQNMIASGVWGVVKVALLAGVNYSTHFEKLTRLLMEVGRSCPRYEEMESLFAASPSLRKALYAYFAAVIDLCTCIVRHEQKSFLAKLPALVAPFDASFAEIQAKLQQHARDIKDEVVLAMIKHQKLESSLQADERQKNARFRDLAIRNQEQHHMRDWKRRLFHLLSDYDQTPAWKQARGRGNVHWIFDDDIYQQWKAYPSTRVLYLTGSLGSGKTVVTSNVVSDLSEQSNTVVSYFFCRFDDGVSLQARTIIGSVAQQLLSEADLQVSESLPLTMSIDCIFQWLCKCLDSSDRVNIICLDGLDDCEEEERIKVLMFVARLVKEPRIIVKIFLSSRTSVDFDTGDAIAPLRVSMSHENIQAEVAGYIQNGLEQRLEAGRLTLNDPSLILKIKEKLTANANGMYLWVYLQLEYLCEQVTDAGIIQALETLPPDLRATYWRILSSISIDTSLAAQVFQITAIVERPLSTEELREALAIELGKPVLSASSLITDILATVSRCGSLLEVDEADCGVHFVHNSVRQFFIDIEKTSNLGHYRIVPEEAVLDLGIRCVTYLNLGIFHTQLTRAKKPGKWEQVSPAGIIESSLPTNASRLALLLLNGSYKPRDISQHVERLAGIAPPASQNTHAFLSYARDHVFTHTKNLLQCSSIVDSLFCNTFNGSLPFIPTPWSDEGERGPRLGLAAVNWSTHNRHLGLAFRILRSYAPNMAEVSFEQAAKMEGAPDVVIETFLRQGLQLRDFELVDLVFKKTSIPEKVFFALLPLTITSGETMFKIWEENLGPCPQGLQINLHRIALQPLGIDFRPRTIRIRDTKLQVMERDPATETDLLTLAAASNNGPAVLFLMSNAVLEFDNEAGGSWTVPGPPNALWLPFVLSALREAAGRNHAALFRRLFTLYPFHEFREHPSTISPRECDDDGWTPLDYAATFDDRRIYDDLRQQSYPMPPLSMGAGFPPAVIRALARQRGSFLFRPDRTEKEVFSQPPARAGSTAHDGVVADPVVVAPDAEPAADGNDHGHRPAASRSWWDRWFARPPHPASVVTDAGPPSTDAVELPAPYRPPPVEMPIEPEHRVPLATALPLPLALTQNLAKLLGTPSARSGNAVLRQDDPAFGRNRPAVDAHEACLPSAEDFLAINKKLSGSVLGLGAMKSGAWDVPVNRRVISDDEPASTAHAADEPIAREVILPALQAAFGAEARAPPPPVRPHRNKKALTIQVASPAATTPPASSMDDRDPIFTSKRFDSSAATTPASTRGLAPLLPKLPKPPSVGTTSETGGREPPPIAQPSRATSVTAAEDASLRGEGPPPPPKSARRRRRRGARRSSPRQRQRVDDSPPTAVYSPVLVFLVCVLWPSIVICFGILYVQACNHHYAAKMARDRTSWLAPIRALWHVR